MKEEYKDAQAEAKTIKVNEEEKQTVNYEVKEDDCSICFKTLNNPIKFPSTKCRHEFCQGCLLKVLNY